MESVICLNMELLCYIMNKNKDLFISIQNLVRYVEAELTRLDLKDEDRESYLKGLTNEILKLNKVELLSTLLQSK